jgi:hypothetical protein
MESQANLRGRGVLLRFDLRLLIFALIHSGADEKQTEGRDGSRIGSRESALFFVVHPQQWDRASHMLQ